MSKKNNSAPTFAQLCESNPALLEEARMIAGAFNRIIEIHGIPYELIEAEKRKYEGRRG